ncbi:Translation initiation factor SUI1 [Pseudocohnilembus persalinus]|uniref:Translation initiation factor SUI1 n=1 Tax=Pseudocohnilembus persalinus TaxID=266149 RepID=A0A0V0R236_PSEPJ|nr:Translation initiation factor SUI1 [Pseudocohnilembus persalinus]|eukprot:KRX08594.1 Translation initiation factor SUI1 [Pseudocohnilembus persalinus]
MEQNQEREKKHIEPLSVQYCGVCGYPPEYCEYSKKFKKCKVWMKENAPQVYEQLPEKLKQANTKEQDEQEKKEEQKEAAKEQQQEEKKEGEGEVEEKKKKKGKKVKNTKQGEGETITVTVQKRQGKKRITLITGLLQFDIKLKDLAKKCKGKFACSASVIEDKTLEIQGDVADSIEAFLMKEYKDLTSDMFSYNKMDEIQKKAPAPKGRMAKIKQQQEQQKGDDSDDEKPGKSKQKLQLPQDSD